MIKKFESFINRVEIDISDLEDIVDMTKTLSDLFIQTILIMNDTITYFCAPHLFDEDVEDYHLTNGSQNISLCDFISDNVYSDKYVNFEMIIFRGVNNRNEEEFKLVLDSIKSKLNSINVEFIQRHYKLFIADDCFFKVN